MNTAATSEHSVLEQAAYETLSLYIDGEFIAGGGRQEQDVVNPATGQAFARLPHASRADLDRALAAAQRAFGTWKHSSPMERSRILSKVGELSREREARQSDVQTRPARQAGLGRLDRRRVDAKVITKVEVPRHRGLCRHL